MQIFMIYFGNFCIWFSLNVSSQLLTYMDTNILHVNFQTVITFKIVDEKRIRAESLDLFIPFESVL